MVAIPFDWKSFIRTERRRYAALIPRLKSTRLPGDPVILVEDAIPSDLLPLVRTNKAPSLSRFRYVQLAKTRTGVIVYAAIPPVKGVGNNTSIGRFPTDIAAARAVLAHLGGVAPKVATGTPNRQWGKTSKYPYVYCLPSGRFNGKVKRSDKTYYCGSHATEEEARDAVEKKLKEIEAKNQAS